MTDLVDPHRIEDIVGAPRNVRRHVGRAVSSEQTVYILHSTICKNTTEDLRTCSYSRLLDGGIDPEAWADWQDQPVVLGMDRRGLIPLRAATGGLHG